MARLMTNDTNAGPPGRRGNHDDGPLAPIRWPLEPAGIATLDGISPDDAWLPLCLALVHRLHRLWAVAASGLYVHARPLAQEHLFQVMRRSLEALCPAEGDDPLAAYLIEIPEGLPPSGLLATMTERERTRQVADFQLAERGFLDEAIERGIDPGPQSVRGVLAAIDARLDPILLRHDELVLKHADQFGLSRHQQVALRRAIRSQYERLYHPMSHTIPYALEAVDRLQEIWATLYSDRSALRRYPNDEQVYQGYRDILLTGLRSDPMYADLLASALALLPTLLPLTRELTPTNPVFREMPTRFERLRYELIAGATALGEPTVVDDPHEPDFDTIFEELDFAWCSLRKAVEHDRQQTGSSRKGSAASRPRRPAGRPRVAVTYQQAAQAWWDCFDDLDGHPSSQEVCERLRSAGIHIGVRTLGSRIKEWRAGDARWPPPRPSS